MIRRLGILLVPLVMILFTACGGKDSDQAPPTSLQGQEHPDDLASRIDLQNKIQQAKAICAEAYAPAVLTVAPAIYANPGIPPQALFAPGTPGGAALANTAPQQEACINAINMAIYNITKMCNGQYWARKDVQDWFYGNIAAIGDRVASRLPPQALANPAFLSQIRSTGAYLAQTYIVPRVSDPKARMQINQQLAQAPYGQ